MATRRSTSSRRNNRGSAEALGLNASVAVIAWISAAWVGIVIGVITILVGVGLLRGSNVARIIATIVFILNLVSMVFTAFSAPGQLWSAIITGLLAVVSLVLLYSARANEFFRA